MPSKQEEGKRKPLDLVVKKSSQKSFGGKLPHRLLHIKMRIYCGFNFSRVLHSAKGVVSRSFQS